MAISAIVHTTQNLGDHGREIDVPIACDPDDTVETLIERAMVASPHGHLAEGADSITLRVVQG